MIFIFTYIYFNLLPLITELFKVMNNVCGKYTNVEHVWSLCHVRIEWKYYLYKYCGDILIMLDISGK